MNRSWSLQYLRAVAAVGVVLFHVLEGTSHRFPVGAWGVDVFFVLSGFLMVTITATRVVGPARFIADRLTRIAPVYWVVTIATVTVARLLPGGLHDVDTSLRDLPTSLFFIATPNTFGAPYPSLFVGWTLNYEIFFYALFAVILGLATRGRMLLLTLLIGALAAAGASGTSGSFAVRFYTDPIMIEFLAGAWLGAVFTARVQGRLSLFSAAGAVGVLIVSVAALDHLVRGGAGRLTVAAGAVALLAASLAAERRGWVPRWPALKLIGDASYSIYLVQVIAFGITDDILIYAGLHRARFFVPADVAVAVAAGIGLHLVVERKLLRVTRSAIAFWAAPRQKGVRDGERLTLVS